MSSQKTIIVYLSCMYVLPVILIMMIGPISDSMIYISFLSYMVLTIYIYNKYNHIYKTAFKEIIKFALLKKILLLSVFVVITNYITGTLLKILGVDIANNQSIIETYIVSHIIITIITFVLLAPFVEEIIYRYILQNWASKYGDNFSILLSSFIFSLVHNIGGNILATIQYFVLGLCFAIVYKRTKNIAMPLAIHMINNLVILIIKFVS